MSNTLLPCPFCGGIATIQQDTRYPRYGKKDTVKAYEPICTNTDCLIYKADNVYFTSEKKAIAAWNRRTETDHIPDTTKMVSNADRIRSMSDEELAEYIFYLGNGSEYCYGHCAYQDDCNSEGLNYNTCIKGVIDWLRQPAETEGTE